MLTLILGLLLLTSICWLMCRRRPRPWQRWRAGDGTVQVAGAVSVEIDQAQPPPTAWKIQPPPCPPPCPAGLKMLPFEPRCIVCGRGPLRHGEDPEQVYCEHGHTFPVGRLLETCKGGPYKRSRN